MATLTITTKQKGNSAMGPDIIEVGEGDIHGVFCVYKNGTLVSEHSSFEEAMRKAYPGWQRDCSFGETCETRGDNF